MIKVKVKVRSRLGKVSTSFHDRSHNINPCIYWMMLITLCQAMWHETFEDLNITIEYHWVPASLVIKVKVESSLGWQVSLDNHDTRCSYESARWTCYWKPDPTACTLWTTKESHQLRRLWWSTYRSGQGQGDTLFHGKSYDMLCVYIC